MDDKKGIMSDDIARFLTDEEIESILSKISLPQIAVSELRNHVSNGVKSIFKYQLGLEKVRPSKIEKLGDFIANKIERSYYQPGFPAGFNTAEALSQPATQLVLNTFHSAGQSGQSGFKRFQRNAFFSSYKKKQENFNMKIHLKNKNYSYEDLYLKAQSFVSVNIHSLLDQDRIIPETYPFEDMSPYNEDFKSLFPFEDYGYAIRLHFNVEKLYLKQILLEEISFALTEMKDCPFNAYCGPQNLGIIDLYIKPSSFPQGDMDENLKIFRYGRLENYMKDHFLGEYKPIKLANVKKIEVLKLVSDVTEDFEVDSTGDFVVSNSTVRVWIDWVFQKKNGVPLEKLYLFLELAGFEVVGHDLPEQDGGNYLIVKSSNPSTVKSSLNKILAEEEEKLKSDYKETGILKSSDLYNSGYYNIIETKGTDLLNVRLHPDVDEFYTISDSPMEIYDVLGLETLRGYLEKEIFDLFEENNENIAPKNITIMVDWMTSGPNPYSFHSSSVKRSYNSFIRAMCFEDPKTAIVKGATLSSEEPLSNTSARILFGALQKLGTGSFAVERDVDISEKYRSIASTGGQGVFRLTKNTLERNSASATPKVALTEIPEGRLPAPANSLFDSDSSVTDILLGDRLSEKDDLEF